MDSKKANQLKNPAPMPRKEDEINQPMKFYCYLICLSGVATYPPNTRIFQQKDLCLAKIYKAIKISDKAVKSYLYLLEHSQMVEYRGGVKELTEEEEEPIFKKLEGLDKNSDKYKTQLSYLYGAAIWKKRNKEEKNGYYYIKRPDPWTPIPEGTIQDLNEHFACTELELKLYIACVGYQDLCCHQGKNFKNITFAGVREAFGYSKKSATDAMIRRALMFLKELGLINYQEILLVNQKNAPIPAFKINKVEYYIEYEIQTLKDKAENTADEDFIEVSKRILKEPEF